MGVAQFFDDLETTVIDWRSAEGFYPPAANPMTSLDDVLPCFSDRVALDTISGARETIYEGINNLNTKLNTNNVNTNTYINAEYKKTTALEMCGVKTYKFNEIGVSSENVAYCSRRPSASWTRTRTVSSPPPTSSLPSAPTARTSAAERPRPCSTRWTDP